MSTETPATPGQNVIVVGGPDNERVATVLETEDGYRLRVFVLETRNEIILGREDWRPLGA